jgi:abelson tyrosine-protein kinase 1
MYLDGTLRWQAPEVMSGISPLTTEVDVYAFAICCVEIMTKGSLPWPFMDDDAVRHYVLSALNISFLLLVFG